MRIWDRCQCNIKLIITFVLTIFESVFSVVSSLTRTGKALFNKRTEPLFLANFVNIRSASHRQLTTVFFVYFLMFRRSNNGHFKKKKCSFVQRQLYRSLSKLQSSRNAINIEQVLVGALNETEPWSWRCCCALLRGPSGLQQKVRGIDSPHPESLTSWSLKVSLLWSFFMSNFFLAHLSVAAAAFPFDLFLLFSLTRQTFVACLCAAAGNAFWATLRMRLFERL